VLLSVGREEQRGYVWAVGGKHWARRMREKSVPSEKNGRLILGKFI